MPSEYLYRVEPTRPEMLSGGPTPEEAAAVEAHFAYLERLTREGVVTLAGRTVPAGGTSFGIVLLRAAGEEEARAVMERDPAVERGVMRAELHPFRTALRAAPGAASLRDAMAAAAEAAYEDAGLRGLCAEGRWECAVDALRRLDLDAAGTDPDDADGAG